jgi:hypothetical protein
MQQFGRYRSEADIQPMVYSPDSARFAVVAARTGAFHANASLTP